MTAPALLLLLTACNPGTVSTDDGDDSQGAVADGDVEARLSALEDALDAANAAAEAAETRIAELEAQAATTTTLDDLDARVETCETDPADLGATVDGQALTLDSLSDQVDALRAASGTPVWPTSASGTAGGRSSSWSSLGSDLDLSVTRVDPIFAWCNTVESSGYASLRVLLTSADESWTTTSPPSELDYHSADMLVPAVAVFTPPEAGDYTLSCEGRVSSGWTQYDLVAVQTAGGVS